MRSWCHWRHSQYYGIELAWLAGLMRTLVLADGRTVFGKGEARQAGFMYKGGELLAGGVIA